MKTITEAVAERISSISAAVNEKVIETLVNQHLNKCAEAILNGMEKLRTLEGELRKIKPDVGGYFDDQGNEVKAAHYSKEKHEERKKKNEQIEKLRAALDLAIEKGDMSKLNDIK